MKASDEVEKMFLTAANNLLELNAAIERSGGGAAVLIGAMDQPLQDFLSVLARNNIKLTAKYINPKEM